MTVWRGDGWNAGQRPMAESDGFSDTIVTDRGKKTERLPEHLAIERDRGRFCTRYLSRDSSRALKGHLSETHRWIGTHIDMEALLKLCFRTSCRVASVNRMLNGLLSMRKLAQVRPGPLLHQRSFQDFRRHLTMTQLAQLYEKSERTLNAHSSIGGLPFI